MPLYESTVLVAQVIVGGIPWSCRRRRWLGRKRRRPITLLSVLNVSRTSIFAGCLGRRAGDRPIVGLRRERRGRRLGNDATGMPGTCLWRSYARTICGSWSVLFNVYSSRVFYDSSSFHQAPALLVSYTLTHPRVCCVQQSTSS